MFPEHNICYTDGSRSALVEVQVVRERSMRARSFGSPSGGSHGGWLGRGSCRNFRDRIIHRRGCRYLACVSLLACAPYEQDIPYRSDMSKVYKAVCAWWDMLTALPVFSSNGTVSVFSPDSSRTRTWTVASILPFSPYIGDQMCSSTSSSLLMLIRAVLPFRSLTTASGYTWSDDAEKLLWDDLPLVEP